MNKIIIVTLILITISLSGCFFDKAHTIKTTTDKCGEFCFYKAKEFNCLQYSEQDSTGFTNGVLLNITDNCKCDLIECLK